MYESPDRPENDGPGTNEMSFSSIHAPTSSANRFRTLSCESRNMSSTDAIACRSMFSFIGRSPASALTKSSPSLLPTAYPARSDSSFASRWEVTVKPESSRSSMVSPRSVMTYPPSGSSPR